MTSDAPGPGRPDPSEPQPPGPPAPPADASPTELVPPPADASPTEVMAPVDAPPPASPPAGSLPPAGPPPGSPSGQPPAQPGWGAPPQQPTWGATAAPGAAPQQPGWAPAPGAPGTPPGWSPAPATSSGNGCLKGCIIAVVILVVIAAIGIAAFVLFARQLVTDIGVNPDTGEITQCSLISNDELNQIFGGKDAEAHPLGGIVEATVGQLLDKRILKDAGDCWIVGSGTTTAVTGRIAAQDSGNASGDFQAAKSAAQTGGYFAGDVTGVGDEAFCTAATDVYAFGILVRSGNRLAYVSLLDNAASIGDWQTGPNGEITSPATCQLAGEIASAVLR